MYHYFRSWGFTRRENTDSFDRCLSDPIKHAFQALALDEEYRLPFNPTIWERAH